MSDDQIMGGAEPEAPADGGQAGRMFPTMAQPGDSGTRVPPTGAKGMYPSMALADAESGAGGDEPEGEGESQGDRMYDSMREDEKDGEKDSAPDLNGEAVTPEQLQRFAEYWGVDAEEQWVRDSADSLKKLGIVKPSQMAELQRLETVRVNAVVDTVQTDFENEVRALPSADISALRAAFKEYLPDMPAADRAMGLGYSVDVAKMVAALARKAGL